MVEILGIYLSPGHNSFGHHGGPAGTHELVGAEFDVQGLRGRGGLRAAILASGVLRLGGPT